MIRSIAVLLVSLAAVLASCGDEAAPATSAATTATSTTTSGAPAGTTTTTTAPAPSSCGRDDVAGCAVFGLVFPEPLPLPEALDAVSGLGGVPIALWRTDRVCVLDIDMMPGPETERVASAFAYVDAPGIRERRMDASDSGLAPPITGLHTSSDYWDQWEDEWAQAQRPGVAIQAIAVYLPETAAAAAAGDGTFAAVVPVSSRRTDSQDPSYPGELLLESKRFPDGYLAEPAPLDCG